MLPQQNPLSVPRGRTQAAKPLTPTTTLTAPTASTRAKAKPQASGSSPTTSTVTRTSSGTAAPKAQVAATRQANPEKKPGLTSETATKPKSQPLKTSLKKEPLKKPPSTKDATKSVTSSENATATPTPTIKDDPQVSSPPVTALEETTAEPPPAESTQAIHISQPQPEPPTGFPVPPADPLQVAAQTYPWLYMSSTLEACFTDAEKTAKKELGDLEKQVTEEEAQLADEKTRHDSERAIKFCDELASDTFSKEAPAIMQSFMTFSETSERIEAEALQLAMSTPSLDSEEPLGLFSAMMDNLDELQEQASEIQSAILRLTTASSTAVGEDLQPSSSSAIKDEADLGADHEEDGETKQKPTQDADSARAQILGVFEACLPVLRARIANLSMAQELIDSAQENFSLALRMESMGID